MSDGDFRDVDRKTAGTDGDRSEVNSHSEVQRQVTDLIGRKEDRRLRAKIEQHQRVWFGLGMFGLVGWSVTMPTIVGAA
ncbi:MAG: hypothetical protein ABGZ24_04760, partial [Fuerstiella sp.]